MDKKSFVVPDSVGSDFLRAAVHISEVIAEARRREELLGPDPYLFGGVAQFADPDDLWRAPP